MIISFYLTLKVGEPALTPTQWEKCACYATGYQLVFLLPADSSAFYVKTRVFSLLDGKFIAESKLKNEPLSELYRCYCSHV